MPLEPGSRLGPYEIRAPLGAGGMGEVYLGRDTKLNRDVALKLLPESVAHDPDRLARFRREAHVLAALNHPHIAQIYGLEDSTDQPALVMELVPGRTLAEVIARGPMPWEEAAASARQIAEALEAAHDSGIIHRDLKPANIKVRDDGVVKVLDFGLAKAMDAASALPTGSSGKVLESPTMTSPVNLRESPAPGTEAGIILGTAAYMAPEQAKGRPADKRADIWAFGVVFAEMLIGHALFAGDSMAETIASVIKDDPKLDQLPPGTPARLRQLLARCLERDPRERLRDIGEARIVLSRPIEELVETPPAARRRTILTASVLGALAVVALTGVAVWMLRPERPLPLRRFELSPEMATATQLAIAPDGSRLAYILDGRLFVRRFDELDARDLGPVHVTARQPVWSPDGRTVAFTAEAAIRTIPADGGAQFVVCQVPGSGRVMGITWLPSGRLVFSVWRDSLYEVPSTGGRPTVRISIDTATEIDFHRVSPLPGGRLLIATHRRREDSDVLELVDGARRTVLTTDHTVSSFEYVPPGVLFFLRRATNPGVWAVPFDGQSIDFSKSTLVQASAVAYSAAADGTLVAVTSPVPKAALIWVDRSGRETAAAGPVIESPEDDLELSPDGTRAAYVQGTRLIAGDAGSTPDANIRVRDLKLGVDTRLTLSVPGEGMWSDAGSPTWFPGGDRLVHRTGGVENFKLVERRADVAGDPRALTDGVLGRILADSKRLIYIRDERGVGHLRSARIAAGGVADDKPLFGGDYQPDVRDFDIAPDGRLAYMVRQPNSRADIYLTTLQDVTAQRLVHEGGVRPRFARGGTDLFFVSGSRDGGGQPQPRLLHVPLTGTSTIAVGPATDALRGTAAVPIQPIYDVAEDGTRFLMWKPIPRPAGEGARLILVQNALSSLSR